jgi:formate--tetrahydrofolate ligase
MLSDVEIAQGAQLSPITEIAESIGLIEEDLEVYGRYKAKVSLSASRRSEGRTPAKLILVTAITPTPAGEGKTTITVGLGDALHRLEKKTCIAIREPSLGPCFGVKGGAAGGGYAQVVPMEEINLHFTGDFHAVTTAHNLLAAMLDNHIQQGNDLDIEPRSIVWRRVMDMNDRALRDIVIGLGGKGNGIPRESGFDITAASEVMAILALSSDLNDLRSRLGRIVVAFARSGAPITAADLRAHGAMTAVMKDAMSPNLVQTMEHTPAFVHAGPFGNIAHGCNSIAATRMAMGLADYVVTEAGFGSDLGAEKFMDIKCRSGNIAPDAVVIVATVRALKMHGGVPKAELNEPNIAAMERGIPNLQKHFENISLFGVPIVVCINRFAGDSDEEIRFLESRCREIGMTVSTAEVFSRGGEGGIALAEEVIRAAQAPSELRFLYDTDLPVKAKIEAIAENIYGAAGVEYSDESGKKIDRIAEMGFGNLPICMAKTQYSLSDNPGLIGRPTDFKIAVRDAKVSAGAGFIVVFTGNIMTMPGLPKRPASEGIDVDSNGRILGLF